MKTISLKVPDWNSIKYGWDVLKFKLNGGFNCNTCDNKMFFNNVQINASAFLFENMTTNMCIDCTIADIKKNADTIFVTNHTCDWCEKEVPTTGFFRNPKMSSAILFGKHWWNGFHICEHCLIQNLEQNHDNLTSSIHSIDKKTNKFVPINTLNLKKKM